MNSMHSGAILIVGISLCVLSGCQKKAIAMRVDTGGKVFLYAQQGNVISWTTNAGTPAYADFDPCKGCSPCAEGNHVSMCTINVKMGNFRYKCNHCQDPVIVVGTEGGGIRGSVEIARAATTEYVYLSCDNSDTIALAPDPVSVHKGDSIEWLSIGAVTSWKVSISNVCSNRSDFDQENNLCNISSDGGPQPGDYRYKAHSDQCKTDKEGTVRIQ